MLRPMTAISKLDKVGTIEKLCLDDSYIFIFPPKPTINKISYNNKKNAMKEKYMTLSWNNEKYKEADVMYFISAFVATVKKYSHEIVAKWCT